nr:PRD domain-containing protein [[Clostridium] innocuum]
MQDTVQQTRIVQDTLTVIKNFFSMTFQEDSIAYYRLVTHLKFFAQRITAKKIQGKANEDVQLLEIVKLKYPNSYECVNRIVKYMNLEFGYSLTNEERLYLTIHIERIRETND